MLSRQDAERTKKNNEREARARRRGLNRNESDQPQAEEPAEPAPVQSAPPAQSSRRRKRKKAPKAKAENESEDTDDEPAPKRGKATGARASTKQSALPSVPAQRTNDTGRGSRTKSQIIREANKTASELEADAKKEEARQKNELRETISRPRHKSSKLPKRVKDEVEKRSKLKLHCVIFGEDPYLDMVNVDYAHVLAMRTNPILVRSNLFRADFTDVLLGCNCRK